jgi:hypothetical protein
MELQKPNMTTTTSDNDERKYYDEWKEFLVSDRTDLRLAAVTAVLQVPEEDYSKLIELGFVPLLAKNANHGDVSVSERALHALVAMSSRGPTANRCVHDLMTDCAGISRMLEIALSAQKNNIDKTTAQASGPPEYRVVNWAMALLANMTRTEEGAVELVGRSFPEHAVKLSDSTSTSSEPKYTLELLLHRFMDDSWIQKTDIIKNISFQEMTPEQLDSNAQDPYQHFAAVLQNATQTEAGRKFVLQIHSHTTQPSSSSSSSPMTVCVLQKLLPQLRYSKNPLRRRGIAGTVRNCIDRDNAWWLLHEIRIVKYLLYPLAGPEHLDLEEKQGLDPDVWMEGPDKVRESDRDARRFLVEAILLLCTAGRKAREQLRLERVYVILKLADMVEEDEQVSELIYDCVNYLRRDEHGEAEGSSDAFVENAYRKVTCAAAGPVGSKAQNEDNYFNELD